MQSIVSTVAFRGIETLDVSVQVHMSNGLPAMAIVGLADKAVAESKERVRAALSSLGLALPAKRIAVNLSPADLLKEGAHFDLPIAMGLLTAMGVLPSDCLSEHILLGELSLDGSVRQVTGILPAALHAKAGDRHLVCPVQNGAEAAWAGDLTILAPENLTQLINHLRGTQLLSAPIARAEKMTQQGSDLADLKGQETARRALEIAAAGGHNLLMVGPPGAGKSMLASRLPSLLPPLSPAESLQATMIHSIAGALPASGLIQQRPFRDPHHSASMASLVGGGQKAWPGEVSLAHAGVLFLDELAEFSRPALDSLRQPLETGDIVIARANHHVRYPARFQLVAAMNPCRCGYLSDPPRACSRAPRCAQDYMARISGPILDRFDILLDVAELRPAELLSEHLSESTQKVRERILASRQFAASRQSGKDEFLNAHLDAKSLNDELKDNDDIRSLYSEALEKQALSARGFHKSIRVARTIADLAASPVITRYHVLEALSYRRFFLFGADNG